MVEEGGSRVDEQRLVARDGPLLSQDVDRGFTGILNLLLVWNPQAFQDAASLGIARRMLVQPINDGLAGFADLTAVYLHACLVGSDLSD